MQLSFKFMSLLFYGEGGRKSVYSRNEVELVKIFWTKFRMQKMSKYLFHLRLCLDQCTEHTCKHTQTFPTHPFGPVESSRTEKGSVFHSDSLKDSPYSEYPCLILLNFYFSCFYCLNFPSKTL